MRLSNFRKRLYVEFISVRVACGDDATWVATDGAIFDVVLLLASAGVRASIYTTAAVGAHILAEHSQFMGRTAKMR